MEAVSEQLDVVATEAQSFRDQFKTLHLATADGQGQPTASYAPFAQLADNQFCIYVSELAAHTGNLFARPTASVIFIEAEQNAKQLFARKRLTYCCTATHHQRDSQSFEIVMDALTMRFGEMIHHLRDMKDFHTFTLTATDATYVRGFAQAYRFEGGSLLTASHINDQGHRDD